MKDRKHPLRPRLHAMAVAAALAMAGHAHAQQDRSPADGVSNFFNRLQQGIGQAASAVTNAIPKPPGQAEQGQQAQPPQKPAQAARGQPPVALKGDLRSLYAKGTVSGADLYETLKAMRTEARARRNAQALASLSASVDSTLRSAQAGHFDISQSLSSAAMNAMLALLKSRASEVGMKALDDHLQTLLDDRNALAQETVTLPSDVRTEAQAKRVVTLATLVVAARVSTKVLDKAKENFKSLEKDYTKLLGQREQATALLYTVVQQRRNAQQQRDDASRDAAEAELRRSFSAQDIAFIDNDIGRLSVTEFQKDMAAQNLAIAYLRMKDPAAHKSYQTQADDFVVRSKAYLRTVSGVAAFGGLMVTFAQTLGDMGSDKKGGSEQQIGNVLQAMPLGVEFVTAAMPAAELAASTALEGAVLQPSRGLMERFGLRGEAFVVTDQEASSKVRNASDVYEALRGHSSEPLLKSALFRDGATGFLAQVGRCDPGEAGRMMDAAVTADERSGFARDYFGDPKIFEGYSFLNALESPGSTPAERRLGETLLGQDHRTRSPEMDMKRREALAGVQRRVETQYVKWGNDQLTRLIFANREGTQIQHATLQLGSVSVRPVPSMQSLYVYESQTDACKRTMLDSPAKSKSAPGKAG